MKIYVCSRIAQDAHAINNKVAEVLARAGYEYFLPHTQHYNLVEDESVKDEDIYRYDMAEMLTADVCVIVGRIGVDCAWEAGWFQAQGIPVVWFVPPHMDVGRNPMFYLVPRVSTTTGMLKFVKEVDEVTNPKFEEYNTKCLTAKDGQ